MFILSLFLLINIINSIVNFGKPKTLLSCGIFGFSGKGNIEKIKMLGVLNDSRGGDGTGYFYNNKVVKGVFTEKKFADLVKKNKIKQSKARVFIGHTRKATSGSHTEENTHPFEVDDMLVLAHNGVIYNIDELCTKYDVDNSNIRVDSKALAHLIHKVGFKVLEEYIGYAALAFTYKDKPNSLFLYHGKSKESNYANSVVTEERPLFYMLCKDVLYFSSLEDSLKIIQDSEDDKIETLNHNVVWEIEDGNFTDNYTVIKREITNLDLWDYKYPAYKNKSTTYTPPVTTHSAPVVSTPPRQGLIGFNTQNHKVNNTGLNINFQPLPKAFQMDSSLFYYKGRHYTTSFGNGLALANGVIFANKAFSIFRREILTENKDGKFTHSQSLTIQHEGKDIVLNPYYFFDGVMIRSKALYTKVMESMANPKSDYYALINTYSSQRITELSRISKYPVTYCDADKVKPSNPLMWLFEGKPATATGLKPQFSEIELYLEGGSLIDYKTVNGTSFTDDDLSVAEDECETILDDKSMLLNFSKLSNIAIDLYITDICNTFVEFRNATDVAKELALRKTKKDFLLGVYNKKESVSGIVNKRQNVKEGIYSMDNYLLWASSVLHTEHCPIPIQVFFNDDDFTDSEPKYFGSTPTLTELDEAQRAGFTDLDSYRAYLKDLKERNVTFEDGVIHIKDGSKTTIKVVEDMPGDDDDLDTPNDRAIDEYEASLADDEEVTSELEFYIQDDPLIRMADTLQPYENSNFGQDVAHMLYLAADGIRQKVKDLAIKHNKEEVLKAVLKQEKLK